MVHLIPRSPEPLSNSPTLEAWDQSVRDNFQRYQQSIDKVTYNLQRAQRGYGFFGSWLYPAFLQRDIQNLKILKIKQSLGKITPEEVSLFKSINPNIAQDLNKTFNSQWFTPSYFDLGLTLGLQVYAQVFNFQYSWRLVFLVGPYFAHAFYRWSFNTSATPTLEFLNYLVQVRQSKSRLERSKGKIDQNLLERYQAETKAIEMPLQDLYEEIINLAKLQSPKEQ